MIKISEMADIFCGERLMQDAPDIEILRERQKRARWLADEAKNERIRAALLKMSAHYAVLIAKAELMDRL
jgi:hypothetical protein